MRRLNFWQHAIAFSLWIISASLFAVAFRPEALLPKRKNNNLHPSPNVRFSQRKETEKSSISYEETDSSSKGLVSSLTGLVNFFSNQKEGEGVLSATSSDPPPKSPEELMQRIRDDYLVRNYLWTGDIDLAAFEKECQFTDPTISFTGTGQFVKNLNNLRPIVDALIEPGGCNSDLLQIELYDKEGYVQSRWNMVGNLTGLPWRPKIDVIGKTKFWYRRNENSEGYQVYFYDEEWEMPATKALLQLITPAGTIQSK